MRGFADAGVPTMLVEADPKCVADLKSAFGSKQNVQIVPNAIWHERTELTFYRANASTFMSLAVKPHWARPCNRSFSQSWTTVTFSFLC